jgi:endonuclease/exonuclease/phosphatase family metal-dependent hydrolase
MIQKWNSIPLILIFLVLGVLIISVCNSCQTGNNKITPENLTIMSYNVRNCIGMDGVTDFQRVADIILNVGADVVALQELDSATQRSGKVVVLDELAKISGMYGIYGPAITFQGGKYGIGMLTREKPLYSKTIALPGSEEPRAMLIVEFEKYAAICTHFSLTPDDRLESVKIIDEFVSSYKKPVFLAGDINDIPSSEVLKQLQKKWIVLSNPELPTYPSGVPQKCIDYIFGLKNEVHVFRVGEAVVGDEPIASDHRPSWVKVEF